MIHGDSLNLRQDDMCQRQRGVRSARWSRKLWTEDLAPDTSGYESTSCYVHNNLHLASMKALRREFGFEVVIHRSYEFLLTTQLASVGRVA